MHQMLRVVDTQMYINGTNDNPQGVWFVELPEDWDSLDQQQKDNWVTEQADILVAPGRPRVTEIVDVDSGEYDREMQATNPK